MSIDPAVLVLGTFAALFGAVIGSFLNVCVVRWPEGDSVIGPRSGCRSCGATLRWYDMVPVLSWLALRARCRRCGAHISVQYPIVELLAAAIWAFAAVHYGPSVDAVRLGVLGSLLLGIAASDARSMLIPDQFTLGGLLLAVIYAGAVGHWPGLRSALEGAALGYIGFWAVKLVAERVFRKPALGVGDIHLMAMIGASVGVPGVFVTLFLGSVLGLVIGVPIAMRRHDDETEGLYLPYGTYLAAGAAIAAVCGGRLIQLYLSLAL